MKLLHRVLVLVICGIICLNLALISMSVEESNNKMSLNNNVSYQTTREI